jgi:IS5 family transposase
LHTRVAALLQTLGKLALALGPEINEQIHRRVVAIAHERRIIRGRRLRMDTTVVETDIHFPTESSLLSDGVRVLTRTMQRIEKLADGTGMALRDRTRTVRHRVMEIARASRSRFARGQERLKTCYRKLVARSRFPPWFDRCRLLLGFARVDQAA